MGRHELTSIEDWSAFQAAVGDQAGSSGLMVFLELDSAPSSNGTPKPGVPGRPGNRRKPGHDGVDGAHLTRGWRIRSGEILIVERHDGVHLRYDTLASAVAVDRSAEALDHARALDAAVLSLIRAAA